MRAGGEAHTAFEHYLGGTPLKEAIETQKHELTKFNAPNAKWISANGFSTNKTNLQYLESVARSRNMDDAVAFPKFEVNVKHAMPLIRAVDCNHNAVLDRVLLSLL